MRLTDVQCCVCHADSGIPVGIGRDFEYNTSTDIFVAKRCETCDLVYLDPRPSETEFENIYPDNYHALDFSDQNFGLIHKIRSRLESQRLLAWCKGLTDDARIVDIGCGDGFHLKLLEQFGKKSWKLEGIDIDKRSIAQARKSGLQIHSGNIESLDLKADHYDLAFMVQTIEHVADPDKFLRAALRILKPGGRLVIVTDNTDSIDFKLFKKGYWGGYHFPRHWNLFNRRSLGKLAANAGFAVQKIETQVTPVNWVYSIHNALVDLNAPRFIINRWTLKSFVSLSVFTVVDIGLQKFGRGGLLLAQLEKK